MNPTKGNGLTTPHSQPAKTLTKDSCDCAMGTQSSKAESTLIARLAMAKHAVHKLADGGYLVCKYGYTYHASDLPAVQAFAVRLGVL
jgi:hypothetical protein